MFWTRWSALNNPVWNGANDLQTEVNRLFDRWGDRGRQFLGLFPTLNVWEGEDSLYLEAELPGLEMKDLEIYVTGRNQLTLKGSRSAPAVEKGVLHRQERGYGNFSRTLTLPAPVDDDQIEARFEQGILEITMPKHEGAKPRKIEIKA